MVWIGSSFWRQLSINDWLNKQSCPVHCFDCGRYRIASLTPFMPGEENANRWMEILLGVLNNHLAVSRHVSAATHRVMSCLLDKCLVFNTGVFSSHWCRSPPVYEPFLHHRCVLWFNGRKDNLNISSDTSSFCGKESKRFKPHPSLGIGLQAASPRAVRYSPSECRLSENILGLSSP